MDPNKNWTKSQIERWLRKNGIRLPGKRMKKDELLALVPSSNLCPSDSQCGILSNFIGHIFNGSGSFPKTDRMSNFLVPAILSSAGKETIFGGDLFYNSVFRDGEWKGAILGDRTASREQQSAARYGATHNDSSGEQPVIDQGTVDVVIKESARMLTDLKAHYLSMLHDPDAPNYYVSVSQNHYHYNFMMLARNDDGTPVGYYYEPHNEYSEPDQKDSGLPYGLAARELERILDISLVYGQCNQYPTHQGEDDLCQSWSMWFAYLLASGMSYDEAQRFVDQESIGGLLAFQMYCYTVNFTSLSYKGTPVFTGSLEQGKLFGRPISIKDLLLDGDWERLQALGFGDTQEMKFTTRNRYSGGGRYTDRTGLL